MFKLKTYKNQKINLTTIVQLLFYSFPLWFIVGNLIVSLNTLLFIVASLFVIKRKQLTLRFNNSHWLLIAFFLYFFLSTTIQFLNPGTLKVLYGYQSPTPTYYFWYAQNPIFKSFLLIRFLILIFVIDTLFFNKILNLKKFFLSSLICTSFVSFYIMLQFLAGLGSQTSPGYSLAYFLGFQSAGVYTAGHGPGLSGPFGDEFIAGSYLQKFSLFSFFYVFTTLRNKNFNIPLLTFTIVLHLLAALLSGNRMPFLLFLFGCVLILLLIKNLRLAMSLGLIFFLSISFHIIKNDFYLKSGYEKILNINKFGFGRQSTIIKDNSTKQDTKKELKEGARALPNEKDLKFLQFGSRGRLVLTAITMWKEQPLFGFGFKSFRVKCQDMLNKDNIRRRVTPSQELARSQYILCSNHPHNYYLELLCEAGIVGASLMIVFFLILLKNSFNYLKKYRQQKNLEMYLLIPVIILFFLEIWPIRTSGSFFSTWNATFFWLNVGLLITCMSKKLKVV